MLSPGAASLGFGLISGLVTGTRRPSSSIPRGTRFSIALESFVSSAAREKARAAGLGLADHSHVDKTCETRAGEGLTPSSWTTPDRCPGTLGGCYLALWDALREAGFPPDQWSKRAIVQERVSEKTPHCCHLTSRSSCLHPKPQPLNPK